MSCFQWSITSHHGHHVAPCVEGHKDPPNAEGFGCVGEPAVHEHRNLIDPPLKATVRVVSEEGYKLKQKTSLRWFSQSSSRSQFAFTSLHITNKDRQIAVTYILLVPPPDHEHCWDPKLEVLSPFRECDCGRETSPGCIRKASVFLRMVHNIASQARYLYNLK